MKAIFAAHGAPNFDHRHLPAFESHDSASMGELRFPRNIIVVALMAGNTHGFWWLVAGGRFSYGLRVAGFAAKIGPIRNPKFKPSVSCFLFSVLCLLFSVFCSLSSVFCSLSSVLCFRSSAAPGYEPAAAYSPASARHVHGPVDRRICWLQSQTE